MSKIEKKLKEIQNAGGGGWISKDGKKIYLVRCPECRKENYALNVSSGICTWCGYGANDKEKKDV